jgi:hypothetical protein
MPALASGGAVVNAMVNWVAKALRPKLGPAFKEAGITNEEQLTFELQDIARTAVGAMRKLSDAGSKAAVIEDGHYVIGDPDVVWARQIDAILAEK